MCEQSQLFDDPEKTQDEKKDAPKVAKTGGESAPKPSRRRAGVNTGAATDVDSSPSVEAKASHESTPAPAREEPVALSVTQFNERVASFLDGLFPKVFRIQGFVSGFDRSYARGGHVYFDLHEKDPEDEAQIQAKIAMVIWRGTRNRLRRDLELLAGPEGSLDDQQIYFEVSVNYWVQGGRLSLQVQGIDVEASLGAQKLDRDKILRRLAAEGLLEKNRQRPMPRVPLRLGLITSLESAAYHDFLKELGLAGVSFQLSCFDARVQGPDQEADMQAAFRYFARRAEDFDALILIRGGGSRSDLMGFDNEPLARAIAASPLPVLTGIGHEIDRSIADEVAYRSLKTPTAVAQFLVQRVERYLEEVQDRAREIRREGERQLALAQRRLDHRGHQLRGAVRERLQGKREELGAVQARLPHAARQAPRFARRHLRHLENDLAPERIRRVGRLAQRRLTDCLRGLQHIAGRILLRAELDLDGRHELLVAGSRRILLRAELDLDGCRERLGAGSRRILTVAGREIDHRGARLRLLDPVNVLKRGFTLTRDAQGRLLVSTSQAKRGDTLITQLQDGELISETKDIRPRSAARPATSGKAARGRTRNKKEDS